MSWGRRSPAGRYRWWRAPNRERQTSRPGHRISGPSTAPSHPPSDRLSGSGPSVPPGKSRAKWNIPPGSGSRDSTSRRRSRTPPSTTAATAWSSAMRRTPAARPAGRRRRARCGKACGRDLRREKCGIALFTWRSSTPASPSVPRAWPGAHNESRNCPWRNRRQCRRSFPQGGLSPGIGPR